MKLHDFLAHHGIAANPFADEDAQTDPVFQGRCRESTFHPQWDKIYGDPSSPATSIVFGEKGAGKTALRLQMAGQIERHNERSAGSRLFVIEYDDFNPFLDRFADRLSGRKRRNPQKVLAEWKLWDHMDAVLSLGVTSVVDQLLGVASSGPHANEAPADAARRFDRFQKRDLLLLAACYDNSLTETFQSRWRRLRRRLRYYPWHSWLIRLAGVAVTAGVAGVIMYNRKWEWLKTVWPWLIVALGWAPWIAQASRWWLRARRVAKNLRCINRESYPLRQVFMQFSGRDIYNQPLPEKPRTDDRYELLYKFQGLLKTLGFSGIVVLVDRVDEPHLVNGSLDNMRGLVWSMLDNKFLKQPGMGFKLLLPIELATYVEKENRDFYQRARLDKQNMVPSLEWTGQSLYDLANARVAGCAAEGASPQLRDLFDPAIDDSRLVEAFAALRVPRHLFKFLYRVLAAHCQQYVDSAAVWKVTPSTFDTQLALYRREQQAMDRGLGV
ncbi:MAG: hypothetical protein DCC67_06815 [Planctomycetota bacterium]|nr:MAG: hypothetical protein DCC67_06815 [Planctomycetota bacterium]